MTIILGIRFDLVTGDVLQTSCCRLTRMTIYIAFLTGCVSLRKYKFGFLNPKESRNRFRVSIQDPRSNPRSLGSWCVKATKESTLKVDSSVPLTRHFPRDLRLVKKRESFSGFFSDLRIQSCILLKKCTL